MKKLLGILVLGLLRCNVGFTDQKPGRFFEDQLDTLIKNYIKNIKTSGAHIS